MKILLTFYWYLPYAGGVWTHIRELKKSLERKGHEVDILAPNPEMDKYYILNTGQSISREKLKSFMERINCFFQEKYPNLDPWLKDEEIEHYMFEAASTYFGLEKYDLIHAHDVYSTRAISRIKPAHIPLVTTIHGCFTTEFFLMIGWISNPLEVDKLSHTVFWNVLGSRELLGAVSSDRTISPSKWLKNLLVEKFGVPESNIMIIPYGIDIHAFLSGVEEDSNILVPPDKTIFICPARLSQEKGHKYLLDALGQLKQTSENWICWLPGDGALKNELEEQARLLNIDEHIKFLGNRNDVPALLNKADIFVLSSVQDNQPFAVMEAQVVGKPVVVTDAGGLPEMVDHMNTGIITSAANSSDLYKALKEVMQNNSLQKKLAHNAKNWGRTQWAIETMTNRILSVYESLLSKGFENKDEKKPIHNGFYNKKDIGDNSEEWKTISESLPDDYIIPDPEFIKVLDNFFNKE